MKRSKPRQHKRRLKSGKVITVNKGRKKVKRSRNNSVRRLIGSKSEQNAAKYSKLSENARLKLMKREATREGNIVLAQLLQSRQEDLANQKEQDEA